ncbi:DUF1275 domain-containing protein [Sphingobacterium shayense]|nr:YoaK family protein [Sphingobacterium shayense]NQD72734.1 DUF1275 domain-containing protein [Sphingobacterium shayense]
MSGVAGIVNITSVLKLSTLATNVTGHFAFFSEELISGNYGSAFPYLFFILSFLVGVLTSSVTIEWVSLNRPRSSYVVPIVIETLILLVVSMSVPDACSVCSILLCSGLLFAMGLQNAMVTRIYKSTIRTILLTGLFTDWVIELSVAYYFDTSV